MDAAVRIVAIDPAAVAADALDPWWSVVVAAEAAAGLGDTLDPLDEHVASLRAAPPAAARTVLLGARDPGTGDPVGYAEARLPLLDNTALIEVDRLVTAPDRRRRGVGTALLDALVGVARGTGRTVLAAGVTEPLGSDGTDVPGSAFARAAGAVPAALEVRRTLELGPGRPPEPAPDPAPGYALLSWTDATPDELAGAMAVLRHRLSTDAPAEELTLEPEAWDADRVRAADRAVLAAGRTACTTAARHVASGELAGYTTMAVNTAVRGTAYQWDTVVAPAHRGHGLGLALKRANTARFRELSPGTRVVHTWNAAVNTHMVAINEALGYRPTAQDRAFELRLRPAGGRS